MKVHNLTSYFADDRSFDRAVEYSLKRKFPARKFPAIFQKNRRKWSIFWKIRYFKYRKFPALFPEMVLLKIAGNLLLNDIDIGPHLFLLTLVRKFFT